MNTSPDHPPPNAPDPLAVALATLDPAPHGFNWNALMFAAGRASKARAVRFWQLTSAVCALAACGFAAAYFTRPPVVVERVVFVDRAPGKGADAPPASVPGAAPVPAPAPESKPEPVSPAEPAGWSFDPPPERGSALRWFTTRNEVLTVGLGVLPDPGRKLSAPREK